VEVRKDSEEEMIIGAHTILYSTRAEAVRAFFRDVLRFSHVDAGHGWLIFAAPPSELAVHPADGRGPAELYLMCDDIKKTVLELEKRGVEFTAPITDQRWGLLTQLKLPDGEKLGLYEPRHKMAIRIKPGPGKKSSSERRIGIKKKNSRKP
jgi:predicted enzyme related to lactoylglutathione lyase